MRKCAILLLLIVSGLSEGFSQDTIYMKSKEQILAKVLEVSPNDVKYKKFDNLDGPEYYSSKSEIARIVYQNGVVDEFKLTNPDKPKPKKVRKYPTQMMINVGSSIATLAGDVDNNSYKANFAGGIGFEIPGDTLRKSFVDITFLYEVKGTKFEDDNVGGGSELEYKGVFQSNEYISVSFAYKRYFTRSSGFYGKLGLYGGYLVSATIKGDVYDPASNESQAFSNSVKGKYLYFDIGGTIGMGYSLPLSKGDYLSYLTTELRYNHSLYNIYDDDSGNHKEYNSSFLVLIGLKFPL